MGQANTFRTGPEIYRECRRGRSTEGWRCALEHAPLRHGGTFGAIFKNRLQYREDDRADGGSESSGESARTIVKGIVGDYESITIQR